MSHNHRINTTTGRLLLTLVLNLLITVIEIIGGIISGSLALISDALHNFSDGVSVVLSYVAIRLKNKDNTPKHTFGLKRAEIFAAVLNSSVLIIISLYLFYESVIRILSPESIDAIYMVYVASFGFVANVLGTWLLHRDSANSLNIRSAYLHLLSDAVSSLAVVCGGLAILFFEIHWLDPVLTVIIGIYIIRASIHILNDAAHVLMEGAPTDISVDDINKAVVSIAEVRDIHHIHLWMVGDNDIYFEAHVNIDDMMISQSDEIRRKIEDRLCGEFNITHVTLQFEYNRCPDANLVGH